MNHPHIPNRLPPYLCASQNYMEAKLPAENYFYWRLATASCDFLPVLQKFSNHSVQDCSWWAGGLWLWKQNCFFPLWMCFYSVSCERTHTTCYSSRAWEHTQKNLKTKKHPQPYMKLIYLVNFTGQHLRVLVLCLAKDIPPVFFQLFKK